MTFAERACPPADTPLYAGTSRTLAWGNRRFGGRADPSVTWCLPIAGWSSSVARWAHNPEVAGSNPVPATRGDDPRGATSGVIFMPLVNGFVNISLC
jgi:hypothetical protein